jgi:plasmid stabilization system protein ParE
MAAIDDRWIGEHGFTDNPLWEKLDAAIATVIDFPNRGELAGRSRRGELLRRCLLPGHKWHVYYTYDEHRALITILAVWYAGRGNRPAL